jgi:hypothetical protein
VVGVVLVVVALEAVVKVMEVAGWAVAG